jgi:hypothetical protein
VILTTLPTEVISKAVAKSPWDFGNKVLYEMCLENPDHNEDEVILGKIWLIGRSYSAAIERRKNKANPNANADTFYENEVAPKIRNSEIDGWFDELRSAEKDDLALHLEAHKRVMDLFATISGTDNRSLASKYLHFHFPERFFIYDSRAQKSISQLTRPEGRRLPPLRERDYDYACFFVRCMMLRKKLETQLAKAISPRDLDNILLAFLSQKDTGTNGIDGRQTET